MTGATFFACLVVFWIGIGGIFLSKLIRGDFEATEGARQQARKETLSVMWDKDPIDVLQMGSLCLFGWPIVLYILYEDKL